MSRQTHSAFKPKHLKVTCPVCHASKGSGCRSMTSKSGEKITTTHSERAKKAKNLAEKLTITQPMKGTNETNHRSITHLHIHINLGSSNEPNENREFGPKNYSDS